jgi:hypothetical protein
MSPTQPPLTPDPFELVLADHLGLPHTEVVAGSFETLPSGLVRWRQVVDGRIVERSVKLDAATLHALAEKAGPTARWPSGLIGGG